jgi:DNA-binding NarL/FixJ family response regulator
LTTYDGDVQGLRALRAGAAGRLLKRMLREELIDTIGTIHAGRRRVPPEIAAGIVEHVADDAFTDRESEVVRRVARGTSNKVIASNLSVWNDSHNSLQRRSCICPAGCGGGFGG